MKALLLIHTATTLILAGLIWTIQIVHYPLFSKVGTQAFVAYEMAHTTRILLLVLPLMFIELMTAFALAFYRIDGIPSLLLWIGLVAVLLIWVLTGLVNGPQHTVLSRGYDANTHQALVFTNWLRTALWTLRGGILVWCLWLIIR